MKNYIRSFILLLIALPLCAFSSDGGCDDSHTGDKAQVEAQQKLTDNAAQQIGMPGVTNFTEKKIMRRLYEMRDHNVATYTYIMDMNGKLHHVCDSYGYGLPYGTQFTSPERPAYAYETHEAGNVTLPQAEPNGLYMPSSAEGTWVICASTKGEFTPMYLEPRVIVSPFRLNAEGGDYALPDNENDALTKKELHSNYIPAVK
jgi:hypothetical protein